MATSRRRRWTGSGLGFLTGQKLLRGDGNGGVLYQNSRRVSLLTISARRLTQFIVVRVTRHVLYVPKCGFGRNGSRACQESVSSVNIAGGVP